MRLLPLFVLVVLLAGTVQAQQAPPARTLTVSASDTVRVTPDRVTVHFAIVTRAAQPDAARQQNEAASSRTLDAVRALNVPQRQIQVRGLMLHEEVEYRQGRRVRVGFIARRQVEVILDDMDLLPAVVARVVQEGANELGGIHYGVRDRRVQEDEALRRAATRARQRAEVLAAALGTSVRGVHSVMENGVHFPPPRPPVMAATREMAMEADMGDPGAYSPGEIDIRAGVTVIFELD